ncbi:MAG TPA: GlxA family transcriptional regulator [Polyangiaceae bacterium]|nr:GlxA family transcriptional regulator [Polyangiaceae bacterium]
MPSGEKTREVLFLAFPDCQVLDVTGPAEVFSQANRALERRGGPAPYDVRLVANGGGSLRTSSGIALAVDALPAVPRRIDTLLVTGGRGTELAARQTELVAWVKRAAGSARRVGSVCTGAFVLAEAGLLDGKRATTHWDAVSLLASRYPKVAVEPDRIFVRDGATWTSAGVTAGIDLALALVAEDHGRKLALEVARQLVVFLKRPGGQSQFSRELELQCAEADGLAELALFIEENVGKDLSVTALARRAHMSPRNFARRFAAEIGTTPARFVGSVRLAAARRRLEETSEGLERIAEQTGFGTTESLRRAFSSALGTTPSEYRDRFGPRAFRA